MSKLVPGMKMPDFTVIRPWKEPKKLSELTNGKKTIIQFLRYLGCRMCQIDILDYCDEYHKFAEAGVNFFVVLQSAPETIREVYKEGDVPFDFILDPDQAIYKELEIGNKQDTNDEAVLAKAAAKRARFTEMGLVHGKYEGNEDQAPASFILDPDLTVRYAKYGVTSADTLSADEYLALL